VFISNHYSLAYNFTKFGRGPLNSGGDLRARLYGGRKIFAIV